MSESTLRSDLQSVTAETIGGRIQQAITEAEISRETACAVMGCSISVLQRMFQGTSEPSALEIARLAGRTGKSFGWFAGEPEGPEAKSARAADHAEQVVEGMQKLLADLLAELRGARGLDDAGLERAGGRGARMQAAKQRGESIAVPREAPG